MISRSAHEWEKCADELVQVHAISGVYRDTGDPDPFGFDLYWELVEEGCEEEFTTAEPTEGYTTVESTTDEVTTAESTSEDTTTADSWYSTDFYSSTSTYPTTTDFLGTMNNDRCENVECLNGGTVRWKWTLSF